MEEKDLSEQESLRIIEQMIQTAKQEQKDDGKGWITWGWLLFAASISTFLNLQFHWYSTWIFWNVFGGITLLFMLYAVIRGYVTRQTKRVKTYTKDLFDKLNIGFFIFLMIIILSINLGVGPVKGFALLIALYGFWILIYGAALNFKPSIIAAFITWSFAVAGLFVPETDFKTIMLLHGGAVLCGYIIPGHIAYLQFSKLQKKGNTIHSV